MFFNALDGDRGFTLIELSIIIVLIGLIVAGVVGGQALIEQAKMRSQISEFNKYTVAYNSFKLEYKSIPGDFSRANAYWGVDDGDGNGRISNDSGTIANLNNENIKFFVQLSAANLIPENFSKDWTLDVGYPSLKIDSSKGASVASCITDISTATGVTYQLLSSQVQEKFRAVFFLNVAVPSENVLYDEGVGTANAKTYYSIDSKIDDSVALSGNFRVYQAKNSTIGGCLDARGGDYLLTNEQPSCLGMYIFE